MSTKRLRCHSRIRWQDFSCPDGRRAPSYYADYYDPLYEWKFGFFFTHMLGYL